MIALPDIAVHAQIYSSANSLVYRGIQMSDRTSVVVRFIPCPLVSCAANERSHTRSVILEILSLLLWHCIGNVAH